MIQLYWKNASAEVVTDKNGISKGDLDTLAPAIAAAHRAVQEQIGAGRLGYAKLPTRRDYRDAVMALVDRYRANTTDLVVLGIGGSALGNIALQAALNPATYNLAGDKVRGGPRLFVLDNVDPALIHDTLKIVRRRLKTTLVNVISKSGETAETASQFMIFREELKKKLGGEYAQRIVATTDLSKGTLHDIATAEGYPMLAVPDDVGGRFSVLSPVGLFSAAMCGIDIDALLAGAAAMRTRLEQTDWRANIGCVLAAITYLSFARKGKPMHVMMPYSNRLYLLADWYRQLWAESLGKNVDRQNAPVVVGPTPIKALGTTDQHSQVQLYREGPNDKLTIFLEVEKHPANVRVPKSFGDIAGLAYLGGAAMGKLLNAEKLATEFAMAKSLRPTVTLRFDEITPTSVGEFIYLFEYVTSLAGELFNIDAYNQPAVELGKKATFALMGRGGYEDVAKEMKPFTKLDKDYLL
ncbi:MAG: glucose-6-phosphate isomerase [Planctomycetaceae bacterium]|nr:glucose-6-phosphate isomerase [Planctomycetaceae bacterium]